MDSPTVDKAVLPDRSLWRRVFEAPQAPLLAAALLGLLYAALMPLYLGPDEMGHLAYSQAITQGHLPYLPHGQQYDVRNGTTYQAQHPPLFYLLSAPFLFLTSSLAARDYILRLFCVAALIVTVWTTGRLARLVLQPKQAQVAAWLVALNPVLVYVCSLPNNDALAICLSANCVLAAARWRYESRSRAGLAWTVAFGGLALLTKLTAIGGVVAAGTLMAGSNNSASSWRSWARFGAVVFGSIAVWLPWTQVMKMTYGTVSPELFKPIFGGAYPFGNMLNHMDDAVTGLYYIVGQFTSGLMFPVWLMHLPKGEIIYFLSGALVAVIITAVGVKTPHLRFVLAAFLVTYLLVVYQAFFRDLDAVVSASRYAPVVTPLVALLAAYVLDHLPRQVRRGALLLWLVAAIAIHAYVFKFFLGPGRQSSSTVPMSTVPVQS